MSAATYETPADYAERKRVRETTLEAQLRAVEAQAAELANQIMVELCDFPTTPLEDIAASMRCLIKDIGELKQLVTQNGERLVARTVRR